MKALNPQSGNLEKIYVKAYDGNPIGTVMEYIGGIAPRYYLLLDGSIYNISAYPELAELIKTTFGSYNYFGGNGTTTFGLPDMRGRVPVGVDVRDVDFETIGKIGGSKELQEHIHNIRLVKSRVTPLTDVAAGPSGYNGDNTGVGYSSEAIQPAGTGDSGNLQPYMCWNFIIKATNSTPLNAHVVNAQSNSTTDTYGCSYMNNKINDINNALNNVRNVNYYALGVNITPTKDCYAEVTVNAYGWGYDGVAAALGIYKSGNPTIILESLGTTQGHNTVADNVTSFGIYRLNAGSTYSFNVGALSGSTGGQTGYVKTINI